MLDDKRMQTPRWMIFRLSEHIQQKGGDPKQTFTSPHSTDIEFSDMSDDDTSADESDISSAVSGISEDPEIETEGD